MTLFVEILLAVALIMWLVEHIVGWIAFLLEP